MKKSRLLVAFGLILAAAAAIVGLAAPQDSTQDLELTVTVGDSFSLTLDANTVSHEFDGFPDVVSSWNFDITATAKSNWRRGYTIEVAADQFTFNDGATGSPITVEESINPDPDPDYITRKDITVGGQDLTASREVVSVATKTPKAGTLHTISFSVTPDGEEYAGSYTTTVTFTMAPKT